MTHQSIISMFLSFFGNIFCKTSKKDFSPLYFLLHTNTTLGTKTYESSCVAFLGMTTRWMAGDGCRYLFWGYSLSKIFGCWFGCWGLRIRIFKYVDTRRLRRLFIDDARLTTGGGKQQQSMVQEEEET